MRVTSDAAVLKVKAALLVILSAAVPLSVVKDTVGVATVLSRVNVSVVLLAVLPAVSVSVTTTVWLPSVVGAV